MNADILALKAELAALKRQFNERINDVEQRLDALVDANIDDQHGVSQPSDLSVPIAPNVTEPQANPRTSELAILSKAESTPKPAKPSFLSIAFTAMLAHIFDWFSPVSTIYQHQFCYGYNTCGYCTGSSKPRRDAVFIFSEPINTTKSKPVLNSPSASEVGNCL